MDLNDEPFHLWGGFSRDMTAFWTKAQQVTSAPALSAAFICFSLNPIVQPHQSQKWQRVN
jgi:hypothetical protein